MNLIPEKWTKVSFETNCTSLSDFICELGLRLDFWRKVISTSLEAQPSIWLPAFYDPKSYLAALK
jgi:hypothetical protein